MSFNFKTLGLIALTCCFAGASAHSTNYQIEDYFKFVTEPFSFSAWVPLLLIIPAALGGWHAVRSMFIKPATEVHVTTEHLATRQFLGDYLGEAKAEILGSFNASKTQAKEEGKQENGKRIFSKRAVTSMKYVGLNNDQVGEENEEYCFGKLPYLVGDSFAYRDSSQDVGFRFSETCFTKERLVFTENGRADKSDIINEFGSKLGTVNHFEFGYMWGCFFLNGGELLVVLFSGFNRFEGKGLPGNRIDLFKKTKTGFLNRKGTNWKYWKTIDLSSFSGEPMIFRPLNFGKEIIYADNDYIIHVRLSDSQKLFEHQSSKGGNDKQYVILNQRCSFAAFATTKNNQIDTYLQEPVADFAVEIVDLTANETVSQIKTDEQTWRHDFSIAAFANRNRYVAYLSNQKIMIQNFETQEIDQEISLIDKDAPFTPSNLKNIQFSNDDKYLRLIGYEEAIYKLDWQIEDTKAT